MTAYWEKPTNLHAIIGAADALVRFAGFHAAAGYLYRWEPGSGNARTYVRFTAAGHARIIRVARGGFRARHVVRCGGYLYAGDVERELRTWADEYLPGLQTAWETCERHKVAAA